MLPLLTEPPSEARLGFWSSRTSLAFDPFEGVKSMSTKIIFCPQCNGPISVGKHPSFHVSARFRS